MTPIHWWNQYHDRIEGLLFDCKLKGIAISCSDRYSHYSFIKGQRSPNEGSDCSPFDQDTLFQIASISKFFSSWLCLKLQANGLLDLTQYVCKDLDQSIVDILPGYFSGITIHHLLCHQAGLKGPTGFIGSASPNTRLPEVDAFIEAPNAYCDDQLAGKYRYSCYSYWLLQNLLERKYNKQFHELFDDCFKPLVNGNRRGYELDFLSTNTNRALGFPLASKDAPQGFLFYPQAVAAAGVWLSPSTMGHLLTKLLQVDGTSAKAPNQISLQSFSNPRSLRQENYNLGIERMKVEGKNVHQHSGHNPGYQSFFMASISTQKAFSILSNDDKYGHEVARLSQILQRLMHCQ